MIFCYYFQRDNEVWMVDREGQIGFWLLRWSHCNWSIARVLLFFTGKNACKTEVCACKKNNLKCCDVCSCRNTCANQDVILDINE